MDNVHQSSWHSGFVSPVLSMSFLQCVRGVAGEIFVWREGFDAVLGLGRKGVNRGGLAPFLL